MLKAIRRGVTIKPIILLLVLTVFNTSSFSQGKKDVAVWLSRNAIAIKDSLYSSENDYRQLQKYLSGKTIIGAGEATHGTADFKTIKYNLFKYLVKNAGFKAIALEVPNLDVQAANDFIISGKGNARDAVMKFSYWTHQTKETEELLEWLQGYNVSFPDNEKVRLYGIDWGISAIDTQSIKDSIALTGLVSESAIDSLSLIRKPAPTGQKKAWPLFDKIIVSMLQTIRSNEASLEKSRSAYYVKSLELNLISLKQLTEFKMRPASNQPLYYRDSCMAENAIWLSENAITNKKLFVGAHDGHINNLHNVAGSYLKKRLDSAYYSIGFEFDRGNFYALSGSSPNPPFKAGTVTVGNSKKNSIGEYFSGSGNFYVDFNSLKDRSYPGSLFSKEMNIRSVGWYFDPRRENIFYQKVILSESFDGIFFIESTRDTQILK